MPVHRLQPDHASAYRALMLQAFAEHPEAFTSSAAERSALPLAWWEHRLQPDALAPELVLGAFHGDLLVGAVGVAFEQREKARHKATLFGMVVSGPQQGQGLGRSLVLAALAAARQRPGLRQIQLTVSEGNRAALQLYQRCGFVPFGLEPDAVAVGDHFVAKVHLWRRLDGAAPGA
jgi:ribosomal protein S18 acetylase RimI-like enzyme